MVTVVGDYINITKTNFDFNFDFDQAFIHMDTQKHGNKEGCQLKKGSL